MKSPAHRSLQICAMILALLFVLAGCAGTASAPPAAFAASLALRVSGTSDKQAMLDYLQAAQGDFGVIDSLLQDKDLDLLSGSTNDTPGSGSSLTRDEVEKYLGLLGSYDKKIAAQLDGINRRMAPESPDVAYFKAAETAEFQTAGDVVQEYEQVLNYCVSMMDMAGIMQLDNLNASDPEATYNAVHAAIGKAVNSLKQASVPAFLQTSNDTFIGALGEMDDAVLYILQAASIDDPVRYSAGLYRYNILTREFKTIGDEFEQDINGRQTKLAADLAAIKTENAGLAGWVQQNIGKLNGE